MVFFFQQDSQRLSSSCLSMILPAVWIIEITTLSTTQNKIKQRPRSDDDQFFPEKSMIFCIDEIHCYVKFIISVMIFFSFDYFSVQTSRICIK